MDTPVRVLDTIGVSNTLVGVPDTPSAVLWQGWSSEAAGKVTLEALAKAAAALMEEDDMGVPTHECWTHT